MTNGLFVTGTDTGVGKTVVTAAITAALRQQGFDAAAYKPVVTGTAETPENGWLHDHRLLAAAADMQPCDVTPLTFNTPASPHFAAELANTTIDPNKLFRSAKELGDKTDILIVEGVGGLMVPLTTDYSICDFARELNLPLLIVARPSLGTINHTLLTVSAAQAAGLTVRAVVLNPWPQEPKPIELSNRATLTQITGLEVHTFPYVQRPEPSLLATAGCALPLQQWLN